MTNAHDPLKSIQSRIDELEQTISERGEQIKARTQQLKEDLQDKLSPVEQIKKHPVKSAALSFVTGLVAGRIVRGLIGPKQPKPTGMEAISAETGPKEPAASAKPSPLKEAMGSIGIELLHTGKDLAISWVKNQLDARTNKAV